MNKDLPNVFPGEIGEDVQNTQEVFYQKNETREVKEDNLSITAKINRIFNSPNYIYKQDVLLKTSNGEVRKTIIGRTPTTLLTMENEVINISDLIDIKTV